ncbi:type VI secretion system-associated protein TagF [Massilia sp. 9I]|uniref:type VI secretion system-associated protein TagF n=1 Tax=Massilia sp. 9I TaxID=2653152 RepID=UPI0012F128CC|nr:type VI secretion system-associated protein TagF [Massilia sp. 9I]VXB63649.1 Protein phosphatase ImpM [Massilia sp. 9I]
MTGYFGKVSTHGDFVSRRLPAHLVQAWDGWLQECIQASQVKLGPAWLERYLNSPVWRFAIAPGVIGPEGIGGVMMPSVDRVGRYFPLMLAAVGAPPLLDWLHGQASWYDAIEDLARESLDPAFTLERLDNAPLPDLVETPAPVENGSAWRLPPGEDVSAAIANVVTQGYSLWWTEGGPFVEESTLLCRGMPTKQTFAAMLDEKWNIWSRALC